MKGRWGHCGVSSPPPTLAGVNLALGKREATRDDRDLKLRAFADLTVLPTPPARFGHGNILKQWGMLGNDDYGDCVFAGAAHETMLWCKLGGRQTTFTDALVLAAYAAVTGFDPDDPSSDQGTYVRDALKFRQKTGMPDTNGTLHKIGAYVALTPGDWDELALATYLFGAVGIGVAFPDSAMEQFNAGTNWDVVAGAKIEGGHYIPVVGRSSRSVAGVITWGKRVGMTKAFYEKYADEAWAFISTDELRNGRNERGLDLIGLNTALQQIR